MNENNDPEARFQQCEAEHESMVKLLASYTAHLVEIADEESAKTFVLQNRHCGVEHVGDATSQGVSKYAASYLHSVYVARERVNELARKCGHLAALADFAKGVRWD